MLYSINQEISYDSSRGGISVRTHTNGEVTTTHLLIQGADIADSGKYTCQPSNAGPSSVKVHVFLDGEYCVLC